MIYSASYTYNKSYHRGDRKKGLRWRAKVDREQEKGIDSFKRYIASNYI